MENDDDGSVTSLATKKNTQVEEWKGHLVSSEVVVKDH